MVVWTQGCSIRCVGCHNPHTWEKGHGEVTSIGAILRSWSDGLRGLTLSGGEPFEQAEACAKLASEVHRLGGDVVVFSGHTLHNLREMAVSRPGVAALLLQTDLLVDGPYDREQTPGGPLRGSANQRLHALTGRIGVDELADLPAAEWVGGENQGTMTGFGGLPAQQLAAVLEAAGVRR
jgi:anaerobic ribonucleoside-triphosphate reductase activating protein